ncbi:Molybdopterin molybdenumtransferase [bacterium HR40]|nr:Molybdopterin molybdenumtransferase [bacterium HR40]
MIAVEEALARILAAVQPGPREVVHVTAAHRRVLAEDLAARRSQPPLAVSAMDGFAVRAEDADRAGCVLQLVGEVPAGRMFGRPLAAGEAVRIFTGAPLPEGADAILIQEHARLEGRQVVVERPVERGRYVRPAGLDFERGWVGLRAGTRLDARALGLAAAMGHAWLSVRRRPRVAILSTGDELVPPGETPGGTAIVATNGLTFAALVEAWGGEPVDLGIAPDDPSKLRAALLEARAVDFIVTSGGASVGSYDLVQATAADLGLELAFWKVAMRPGKPLIFGRLQGIPFLGFPGNPVSSTVCAIVFLRAAIRTALGLPAELPYSEAVLDRDLGANDERQDFLRANFVAGAEGGWRVRPAPLQDSSMFATLARADVLLVRPPFDPPRQAGERVRILELERVLAG